MNENEGTRTLGQIIGKVVDNFSIKNDNGDSVQLKVTFDFTTSSDNDIRSWLCGNRRIALQRPSRSLSKVELEELNGQVIMASDCGKKVKSRQERIAELVNIGLSEEFAIMAVDDPEGFKALMNKTVETSN